MNECTSSKKYSGAAPNEQMFPNTPEVPQMVFSMLQKPVWLIGSCPNNYLSVRMSHPKVLATLIGPVESSRA